MARSTDHRGYAVSRTASLRALATLLMSCVVMGLAVLGAAPAHASCAFANPPASPYRFTGVVVRTDLGQRIAYVTTDDGRDVVVRGTEATQENGYTSVDRTYLTGHVYEFHPSNASSPYRDSICSATTDLGSAPTEQPAAARTTAESELADGTDDTGVPRTWLLLGAAAGVVLLLTGVLLVRRGRPSATEHTAEPEAADRPAPGREG